MVSKAEENVSRSLRQALAALAAGTDVPESETFRSALVGLEIFLSQVLAEVYREWRGESLDGVTRSWPGRRASKYYWQLRD